MQPCLVTYQEPSQATVAYSVIGSVSKPCKSYRAQVSRASRARTRKREPHKCSRNGYNSGPCIDVRVGRSPIAVPRISFPFPRLFVTATRPKTSMRRCRNLDLTTGLANRHPCRDNLRVVVFGIPRYRCSGEWGLFPLPISPAQI